jgi:DNA-binding LacI/PurR family transcriptional regulator
MSPPARDLARLVDGGVPVVLVDARGEGVPMVVTDDVEGGRMATRHLIALGHERVAFMGADDDTAVGSTSSAQREQGYAEVLAEVGQPLDPAIICHGPHDRRVAQQLAQDLLAEDPPPTAIFATSDVQALGVIDAAAAAGVPVPEGLSVVGFDDIELAAYAQLTTVHQPLFDSGFLGATVLLDALDEADPPRAVVHELPLELVERATTAPPKERAA